MLCRYRAAVKPDTERKDLRDYGTALDNQPASGRWYRLTHPVSRYIGACAHPRYSDGKIRVGRGRSFLRTPADIARVHRLHASFAKSDRPGLCEKGSLE